MRGGKAAVSRPAATSASIALRITRCHVTVTSPIVRCSDVMSVVSAECG
jgi:hypothetical protein